MAAAATHAPTLIDDQPPRISWRLTFMLFVLATVLRFPYFYLDDLTRQVHGTLVRRLLEEGTGNFASAILFPIASVGGNEDWGKGDYVVAFSLPK